LTTLHSFEGVDGNRPEAGLALGTNGSFYGTTAFGGTTTSNNCPDGCGTAFKITPGGTLTTLYSFCSLSDCADGRGPTGALVQGNDGNFYGTTNGGGANSFGTVFKITPTGTLTTLLSFDLTDGAFPEAGLIQASNGNFFGTTTNGGSSDTCNGYPCGTVFKITPSGTLTTLHSFDATDGEFLYAGLVQGTNGTFYGTTSKGGANDEGTVFSITANGTLTTLHSFDTTDGNFPQAGLAQDTNGDFYGTTAGGGANGDGTVFSLSVGLGPFVITQTTSGAEGAAVNILGTSLTGASSVTFGGIAATFTVVSASEITTTVPAGAFTGSVKVTIGANTLTSAQTYRVTPTISSFSPPSGPVGTPVTITGTGLTQTSKVTFNNTVATFTVNSDTQVTATVPTGATTGKIAVTTLGGTATSATSFTVN
jgi:uncharacterized repeat protein (TIGR03803 family)